MGAAQSKRNRMVSAWQADTALDAGKRDFFDVLDRINAMPRGTVKPFAPVVIEPPGARGKWWWLMRAGKDRHHHYAYCYRNLGELMAAWSLAVTGFESDKNGDFYTTVIL